MSMTEEQSRAVRARGKVIVSAAAGSGKTRVMIERLIALIADEGADVRSALAVTFTNKAAAQMRERLRRALLDRLEDAEGDARDRLLAQLRALPAADMCTLHAFCGRLVRAWFFVTGADPAFRIAGEDDAEMRALSARAMDEVFERAFEEKDESFASLLSVFFRKKKDEALRKAVLELYGRVRELASFRETLEAIGADGEEQTLRAERIVFEADLRRIDGWQTRLERAREPVLVHAPKAVKLWDALSDAYARLSGAKDLYSLRARAAELPSLRAPNRDLSDPDNVAAIDALRALAAELKELCKELLALSDRETERACAASARGYASALARLVLRYHEAFSRWKREAGLLDYNDLEHEALAVLSDGEAGRAVRARYRYVFVDEFQDVNPMQSAILERLAGEDIFFVGDDRQAIYGFRGSRSRFFTDTARAFEREEGAEHLRLTENFRSAQAVLDFVNRAFGETEGYVPMRGGRRYGDFTGEVTVRTPLREERISEERGVYSVERAAARSKESPVADEVLRIVLEECGETEGTGRSWRDVDAVPAADRQVRYGDIAVLVRKRSKEAGSIVRKLSEAGIPVTSSAEVNVCDFFEGRLLIDWLSFLDDPEQDIPMATAMLSVLGGFTDRELALVRLKTQDAGASDFRAACALYRARFPADPLARKLERFKEEAARYRRLSRVHTAAETLAVLLADGLEAQIAAKGDGKNRLARVSRLVQESEGCGSVHAFLKKLRAAAFRVRFSESGGENAVRIVTMHSSKGLEYPVVILAELNELFKDHHDELLWTEELGVALHAFEPARKVRRETIVRQAAKALLRREDEDGERNLLYVAMTRARCRLHLIAEERERGQARCLADFLPRDLIASCRRTGGELPPPRQGEPLVYRADPAMVKSIEALWEGYPHAGSERLPVKDSATGLLDRLRSGLAPEEHAGAGHTPEEGVAYHAFLEHCRFGEPVQAELGRLKESGVLTARQLDLIDGALLERVLRLPVLASLKGKPTRREQTFLVSLPASLFGEAYGTDCADEIVYQGAIDLLAEEDGGYLIVDYKFTSLDDASAAAHYAVQLRLYRAAVAKIEKVPPERVRAVIVNIAEGREIPM